MRCQQKNVQNGVRSDLTKKCQICDNFMKETVCFVEGGQSGRFGHLHVMNCLDGEKKWKTLKIIVSNEITQKKEFRGGFINNFQKLKNRKRHLSLRLLWFQKIYKKSMSISLQTYDKTGGAALCEIAVAAARSKLF